MKIREPIDDESDNNVIISFSNSFFNPKRLRFHVNLLVLFFFQEIEKDAIAIEIINMTLYPTSSVMQNPDYELLYVEYCFLGYCGADMETISVRKPSYPNQVFEFNFKKRK